MGCAFSKAKNTTMGGGGGRGAAASIGLQSQTDGLKPTETGENHEPKKSGTRRKSVPQLDRQNGEAGKTAKEVHTEEISLIAKGVTAARQSKFATKMDAAFVVDAGSNHTQVRQRDRRRVPSPCTQTRRRTPTGLQVRDHPGGGGQAGFAGTAGQPEARRREGGVAAGIRPWHPPILGRT